MARLTLYRLFLPICRMSSSSGSVMSTLSVLRRFHGRSDLGSCTARKRSRSTRGSGSGSASSK